MYRVVQLDSQWIVCVGASMLLAFDRIEAAAKTVQDAEKLLSAAQPAMSPGFANAVAEVTQHDSEARLRPLFVERRRSSRAG